MANAQGVVESFNPRGKKVGRGSIVYSFKLDDGEWYRTGFDKPPIEEGDKVRFSYDEGEYGKEVKLDTMQVKKNPNGGSGGAASSSKGQSARDKYWEDREARDIEIGKRIGYAGCLNSSIALMANLLTADAFPVSASKLKSKAGLEAAQEVLVQMADEFWNIINNRPNELSAEPEEEPTPNGADELDQTKAEAKDDGWDDKEEW